MYDVGIRSSCLSLFIEGLGTSVTMTWMIGGSSSLFTRLQLQSTLRRLQA